MMGLIEVDVDTLYDRSIQRLIDLENELKTNNKKAIFKFFKLYRKRKWLFRQQCIRSWVTKKTFKKYNRDAIKNELWENYDYVFPNELKTSERYSTCEKIRRVTNDAIERGFLTVNITTKTYLYIFC